MAAQPTAQRTPSNWVEYPVQTPNGNYVNGRFDPASGEIQAQIGGDWQTISNVGSGTSQAAGQLSAPAQFGLNQQYLYSGMGWALPSQQQVWAMRLAQQQRAAQGAPGTQGTSTGTGIQAAPSYWGAALQPGAAQAGSAGAPGATGVPGATGATGAQTGGTSMATTTAGQIPTGIWGSAGPKDIAEWQTWYGRNVGKTILVNGQPRTIGTDIQPNELLQAFQGNTVGWGSIPGAQAPAQAIGGPGQAQPESVALQQMAQIDPTSEALRQSLGQSYLTNLAARPSAPAAGDVQSYLDLYKQIDPQGYAQRVALAGGMDQFVQNAQAQAALGSQLDPGTIREVEQGTRAAQIARGNVYGTPQLVAETMARGSAGEQRLLQRQQMLQSALGQQQSYLGSGLGLGDVANTLYNQGYNRFLQGQGAALGYLGSGQTPYQAGASYYDRAQQQAAMAAQGGPQYNPPSLGQQYTGAGAPSFPDYGLQMSNNAANWYNSINTQNLQAYGLQQAYGGQKGNYGTMGSGIGTAIGSGIGALFGGVGAPIGGALGGAIGGAAGSSFSR